MSFAVIRRTLLVLILSTVFVVPYHAFSKDEWRPITKEELELKEPKVEADADAEAMFWEVRVNDRSRTKLTLEHYVRVKIFTERGREKYSKFDIPYTKRVRIKNIAARVIKPDGSITVIGKKDIFDRDIVKVSKVKVKSKSFAVPNIGPGVIVEYRYQEIIRNAGAVGMKLLFQRDIPVHKISYYYRPFQKKSKPRFQSYNFNDTEFVKDRKGYYLAEREDVPAFKGEPYMPPEDMVRPWMLLQAFDISITSISRGSIGFAIKDPSNPTLFWSGYATEQQSLVNFVFKKDKNTKKMAEEVTRGAFTDEEKLRKLYEFCQAEIHNTSYDASLTDEQRDDLPKIKAVKDVVKRKQGPATFVDFLFGAMAKSLGYDARIMFSGDRSEMFFNRNMTNEDFVHRSGIAVKLDGEWKFFSPGIKFMPYGMLAWHDENVWALLVGEKRYDWVKTPYSGYKDSNIKRKGRFKLTPEGVLEGKVTVEQVGQVALDERLGGFDESESKREEDLINELKEQMSTAEVNNVVISNMDDHRKPLIYTYDIRIPSYATKTGKRLFFRPSVFTFGRQPLFASADRKYDVYFSYPWSEADDIQITLPDGFELDNADAPASVADPNKIGVLTTNIGTDQDKTTLFVKRNFHFGGNGGRILFPVAVYQPLKNLFDAFSKADAHSIALKKKAVLP